MAEAIQASLDQDTLHVLHPGDTVTAEITITNIGTTPDRYRLEMDGLPPAWCQLVYADAVVAPRQRHTARLVVRTAPTAAAGVSEFTLSVLSANDPEQRTRVTGTLQIGETEAIGVHVQTTRLQITQDGASAQTIIVIENRGTILDRYVVEVTGLEGSWFSLSNTGEVPLQPGETKEITLVVSPPPGGGAKAGIYSFTITARSRVDLTKTGRAQAVLQVAERAEFSLSLDPGKVTGRTGSYKVIVDNSGNTDLDLTLDAIDTRGACDFTVTPRALHVPHGQKETVLLAVTAPRSNLIGRQKSYPFEVKGKPSQGQSRTAQGEFVHSPWVHPGRTLVVAPLLAVALGVAVGVNPPLRSYVCRSVQVFCTVEYSPVGRLFRLGFGALPGVGRPLAVPIPGPGSTTVQTTTNGLMIVDASHRTFFIPRDTTSYQYQDQAGVTTLLSGPHLLLGHTLPVDPALPISNTAQLPYDATTRHNVEQPLLRFWQENGAVGVLGRPQTEPFCARGSRVEDPVRHGAVVVCVGGRILEQYFDNFRLDDAHGAVTIAPLGQRLGNAGQDAAFIPVTKAACLGGAEYVGSTHHCLADPFLSYLRQQPAIGRLLGPPISEQTQIYLGDDPHPLPAQWFENGRLEVNAATSKVELSALGLQDLYQRGWIACHQAFPTSPCQK